MTYFAARSLDDALAALGPGARVLAGGTDIYPALGDRPADFDIVDITRAAGLRGIAAEDGGGWRLGAATTWSDIVKADLPPLFDGLKAAAREVGAVQIQNTATLAGNLCNASPAADGVPALLALGASVELASRKGVRRLALGDFITGVRRTALMPGEMMSAIIVPPHAAGAAGSFAKLGARRYLVISIAMVAAVVVPEGGRVGAARVAVGACSPVALRLGELEAALVGAPLGDLASRVRAEHFSALTPITDVRGTSAYREEAVVELVCRALADAGARAGA